jgi:hypothetical protein
MTKTNKSTSLTLIERVLGKRQGKEKWWYGIDIAKIDELLKQGLLATPVMHDHGATDRMIVDLIRRHPELRATGVFSTSGVVLNGMHAHGNPIFDRRTVEHFAELAARHGDDFEITPAFLYIWFD